MVRVVRAFPILLCLAIGVAGIAASIGAGQPSDDDSMVAVFPPWWSASRVLAEAGRVGDVLNSGAFPFVLIVQSQQPGLGARLRAAGAVLLLNPMGMGGCDPTPSRNQDV